MLFLRVTNNTMKSRNYESHNNDKSRNNNMKSAVMQASIEKSRYNDMSLITIGSVLTEAYRNYEISL